MEPEKFIIRQFAESMGNIIASNTIKELQKLPAELLGVDSGLKNVWEEICVQVQDIDTVFWKEYEYTIATIVLDHFNQLKDHEKTALWFQTQSGKDWLIDTEMEKVKNDNGLAPLIIVDDIIHYIVGSFILIKAEEWTNKRIDKYLNNRIYDDDSYLP